MSSGFSGFPKAGFDFLDELKENNTRDWFQANKKRYRETLQDPLLDFIQAMVDPLAELTPHFVADARRNGGSMFRIHRDVRFSKDKRPYKEHAACHFRHGLGRDVHAPGFYVHLATDEVFYGAGIWLPPSDALYKIRRAITDRPEAWSKVIEDKALKKMFGGVGGDGLQRPPKGFTAASPHLDDLKRKTFFLMHRASPEAAQKPEFLQDVVKSYKAAMPMMHFLCKAVDVPC
ncbi:DUF2461 domain-containing protein [Kiloniella laminariae]|uniref:DUF2461 domain-containing protein n=1 Tax=Kiloniella laminariae TaxID=454162 RepID=A0ABT4LJ10_9PROT|nr:DUF2461 domain-containing protein [Kiloniella laminariae]MCZ4281095.1 DUF2461 domain-containing protein [Kiloniella laminariae]